MAVTEQIATTIADQSRAIYDIMRGDPFRIPFLRLTWTGSLACPDNTDVTLIAPLALDTFAGPGVQGSIWDTSALSSGFFGVKANGLLIADVAVAPAVSYTGMSGRLEMSIANASASVVARIGTITMLGNFAPGDTMNAGRIAGRLAESYRFRFRWRVQVSPTTFTLGGVFATLIWLPIRY